MMPEVLTPGGWRTITGAEVFVGGEWRDIAMTEAYVGGVWKEIASFVSPLSVSISPSPVAGRAGNLDSTPLYVTSALASAMVVGGEAPFSYTWSIIFGSMGIFSPNDAATKFGSVVDPFEAVTATARVVVTDASGTTATATVNVTLRNTPTV